jgi:hypothetical protein
VNRVVVLGRGGAGKSALAARLGVLTGLPVIELDKYFWSSDLTPLPMGQWKALQRSLISAQRWILDGDLGPYDAPSVRLKVPTPSSCWTSHCGVARGAPRAALART